MKIRRDRYLEQLVARKWNVKDQMTPWRNDNGTLVVGLKDFLLNPGLMEGYA